VIFPDYSFIVDCAVLIGLLLGAVCALRVSRHAHLALRVIVRILSSLTIMATSLVLLMIVGCESDKKNFPPVYSPDHKRAFVMTDADAGATGGGTYVTLYSNYGLTTDLIFSGNWQLIGQNDVSWSGNSDVLVTYPARDKIARCGASKRVRVTCIPEP
jgi:hypothetical protein